MTLKCCKTPDIILWVISNISHPKISLPNFAQLHLRTRRTRERRGGGGRERREGRFAFTHQTSASARNASVVRSTESTQDLIICHFTRRSFTSGQTAQIPQRRRPDGDQTGPADAQKGYFFYSFNISRLFRFVSWPLTGNLRDECFQNTGGAQGSLPACTGREADYQRKTHYQTVSVGLKSGFLIKSLLQLLKWLT